MAVCNDYDTQRSAWGLQQAVPVGVRQGNGKTTMRAQGISGSIGSLFCVAMANFERKEEMRIPNDGDSGKV